MTKMSVPNVKTSIDRAIHAVEGRMTNGLSPASIMVAYFDWLVHMAHSPGKMGEMSENFPRKSMDFTTWAARATMDKDISDFIQRINMVLIGGRFNIIKEPDSDSSGFIYYLLYLLQGK